MKTTLLIIAALLAGCGTTIIVDEQGITIQPPTKPIVIPLDDK
jgi:hypothetical protein